MALPPEQVQSIVNMLRSQPPEMGALVLRRFSLADMAEVVRQLDGKEREKYFRFLPERDARKVREQLEGFADIPDELMNEIMRGHCVLFLGAGISVEAGMPGTEQLVRLFSSDPSITSLAEAAQSYLRKGTKASLCVLLRQEFDEASEFVVRNNRARSHQLIANIPKLNTLIVTTNYDHLLEDTILRETGERRLVVCRESDLSLVTPDSGTVIKLHGDYVLHESVVISEEDYKDYVTKLTSGPGGFGSFLANLFTERTIIFVGFQMEDADFKLIWESVSHRMRDSAGERTLKQHYAVNIWTESEARVIEQQTGIKVIRVAAKDFFETVFRRTSEFVNRTRELREICEDMRAPFVEIVGPAGSGKSSLLTGIETYYRYRRGYRIFLSVSLQERLTPDELLRRFLTQRFRVVGDSEGGNQPELDRQQAVRKLMDSLKGTKALITIDATEEADDLIRWMEEELLHKLKVLWRTGMGEGRVIFASRQQASWSTVTRINLDPVRLSPFDQDAVEQMVKKHHILRRHDTLAPTERRQIARQILRLSGTGHAGLIRLLIDEIMKPDPTHCSHTASLVSYLRDNAEPLLREHLVPELEETVLKGLPDGLRSLLLNLLCVFRVIDASMLETLQGFDLNGVGVDKGTLDAPEQIVHGLKQWRILADPNSRNPFYQLDPVVGFLYSSWLLQDTSRLDRYAASHYAALMVCNKGVEKSTDQQRLTFSQEGLYHLQCLRAIGLELDRPLVAQVAYYLNELELGAPNQKQELAMRLRDMVSQDRELKERIEEEFEFVGRPPSSWEDHTEAVLMDVTNALDAYIQSNSLSAAGGTV